MTASKSQRVVAYLYRGVWYTPEIVHEKRLQRSPELEEALPYSIPMLHRRREFGRDLPQWINLDQENENGLS